MLDEGKNFVLTYLPIEEYNDKGKRIGRANKACFVAKDDHGFKHLYYYDDPKITDDYEVNVSAYGTPRWDTQKVYDWYNSENIIEPKKVFDDSRNSIGEYFEYQDEESYDVVTLWNIGTYFYDLFNTFPYLDFHATKGSGKTKNLDYQRQVCYNAIKSSNITGASQFRTIDGMGATILIDETENLNNPKSERAQDTLTILHSGFMKGDSALRTEGNNGKFRTNLYDFYGPKCLAHINSIGDVLADRCISIPLIRSINKNIINKDVEYLDPSLQTLRDSYYQLRLDWVSEIDEIRQEARKLLDVSGRELKLWTPLITLALFFERHGCEGLVDSIKRKCYSIHEKRLESDGEFSPEGMLVRFIQDKIRPKRREDGSILFGEIERELKLYKEDFGFSEAFKITQKWLSMKLGQLGFSKIRPRTSDGWLYNLSDDNIDSALHRFGISFQATLGDKNVK